MCFTLGGGGSRGDVTQNSYINRRPWEQTDAKPMSLGDQIGASGSVPGMLKPEAKPAETPTKNRSSLTTGGSA
tara:strand:+ start:314 stop:532 length:219 start_codon:yes stop_codon:yes gene_type:complete